MALSKEKKVEILEEVSKLLDESKLTVMAQYSGTSVSSMQELRASASENGTQVKVIKNRLFKKSLSSSDRFKQLDSSAICGQLLYAFNSEDEVAPAQVLANFAKNEPQLTFVGAINADGVLLSAEDVKQLAALPSKDQLRAQLVGTIAAPISGFANVLAGNVRGVLNVLSARAEQI
jgi:large subunit ribosomal protein L10